MSHHAGTYLLPGRLQSEVSHSSEHASRCITFMLLSAAAHGIRLHNEVMGPCVALTLPPVDLRAVCLVRAMMSSSRNLHAKRMDERMGRSGQRVSPQGLQGRDSTAGFQYCE